MITILLQLLVVLLIVGLIFLIARQFGVPQLWLNVVGAVIGIVLLIWVLEEVVPLATSHPLLR